jgi:hypothetical protein
MLSGQCSIGRFNEDQLFAVAEIQRVAGFHGVEIPLRMMVMAVDGVDGVGGAINWRVRECKTSARSAHQHGLLPRG